MVRGPAAASSHAVTPSAAAPQLPQLLSLARPAHPAPLAQYLPRCCPRSPSPAQSGIDVSDELLALYDQVKLKKAHKFIVFALAKTGTAAGKDVYGWNILERSGPQPDENNQAAFVGLVKSLPEAEARFVVFDFTESKADGRQVKKLVLIKWCVAGGRGGERGCWPRARARAPACLAPPPPPAPAAFARRASAPCCAPLALLTRPPPSPACTLRFTPAGARTRCTSA